MSVAVGDEITVVTEVQVAGAAHKTIRAQVAAVFPFGRWRQKGQREAATFRWSTPWLAEGYCKLADEGTTWARGYVDELESKALLASFALGPTALFPVARNGQK